MSWLFSRALVEAYSEENSLDGKPLAQLNVMHTPHQFWRDDKTTVAWNPSQFGQTYAPFAANHGEALLTSFLAASRARTSASQEKAQGSTDHEADSGGSLPESFAKFDSRSSSWKIRQLWLFADLDESLATWPRWGMMRDGECWELETPEGCTNEIESGLLHLPTPGKNEYRSSSRKRFIGSPDFRGAKTSEGLRTCLADPTYTAPRFCEIIMGFPTQWTELQPSAMPNIQAWLNSHGKPSTHSENAS